MNKSQKYSVAVMGGRVAGANDSVGGGYLIAYVSIVG